MGMSENASGKNVQEAVHRCVQTRVRVAKRMVQASGEFDGYVRIPASRKDHRHLFQRRKRRSFQAAAASFETGWAGVPLSLSGTHSAVFGECFAEQPDGSMP